MCFRFSWQSYRSPSLRIIDSSVASETLFRHVLYDLDLKSKKASQQLARVRCDNTEMTRQEEVLNPFDCSELRENCLGCNRHQRKCANLDATLGVL